MTLVYHSTITRYRGSCRLLVSAIVVQTQDANAALASFGRLEALNLGRTTGEWIPL